MTFASLGSSYIFDTGLAIHENGKIEEDNTISNVKGYITFTLYSRIVQLKYTKTRKAEYDVQLKIGISSETLILFSVLLNELYSLF